MGVNPGRIRSSVALALMLLAIATEGSSRSPAEAGEPELAGRMELAEPSVDPCLPEWDAESLSPEQWRACDSVQAEILCRFRDGGALVAPGRSASRLVAWMAQLLAYPDSGFVATFARRTRPEDWAPADSSGILSLTAACAFLESGLPEAALEWIEHGAVPEQDRSYALTLELEALSAAGDTAAALAAARAILTARAGRTLAGAAASLLVEDRERAGDGRGLLDVSLEVRRLQGRGPEETAARYRAYRLLTLPGAMRGVGDTLLSEFPGTRTARVEALRRFREAPAHAARVEGRRLFDVLLRHRQFSAADSLLRLMRGTDSLRVVLLESLYQNRSYSEVLAVDLSPSDRWSRGLRTRLHLVCARAARNTGRWDRMVRSYELAASLGGETRRTALEEMGREAESAQREAAADSVYSRLMALEGSADEGAFRRAVSRVARGAHGEALADLRRVGSGDFASPAAFWSYRVLYSLGDSAEASAALSRAAAGFGYYARRAREQAELGLDHQDFWRRQSEAMFSPRSDARSGRETTSCLGSSRGALDRTAARIRLFRRFGRTDWANGELDRLERLLGGADRAKALQCLGLFDRSVRAAIGSAGGLGHLRYPRPFSRAVVRAAGEVGLSPSLVWSIARRESLFDPGAVSGAGARGLMQMMKPTAEETASRWKIPSAPLERYDVNLRLGTRHLVDLRTRHPDWHVPALLAAYNAGEAKAAEWVERFPDPDLFIERIGWRETREYVRHILDAFWIYERADLGAGPADGQP